MPNKHAVQPLKIQVALLGEQRAGKTTFITTYYNTLQSEQFQSEHLYRLHASDILTEDDLKKKLQTYKDAKSMAQTIAPVEYAFDFHAKDLDQALFQIQLNDYPGEWWESVKDIEEQKAKAQLFNTLGSADIGLFYIDSAKLVFNGLILDEKSICYVKTLLKGFCNELRTAQPPNQPKGKARKSCPRTWMFAVSKADLLPPNIQAKHIGKNILLEADDELEALREIIGEGFNKHFLLISSEKGTGLSLIAPIIFSVIINDQAKAASNKPTIYIYKGVEKLLITADRLKHLISKIKTNHKNPWINAFLFLLKHLPAVIPLDGPIDYFRKRASEASKEGNLLMACVNAINAELSSEEAKRVYFGETPK